jgi:hypothetical protein
LVNFSNEKGWLPYTKVYHQRAARSRVAWHAEALSAWSTTATTRGRLPNCDAARHACGFKLANDGHNTRDIQAYLGHRSIIPPWLYGFETKSVQEFLNFWKDGGSKPLEPKVIRPGNTEPDGRIKQMAAKFMPAMAITFVSRACLNPYIIRTARYSIIR